MSKANQRLAESLRALRRLQKGGRRVFESRELTRVHRERLLRNGFLQDVVKGWLISSGPNAREGNSTPWYASFWEFCARYCNKRFGRGWHLSPEQSLLLQAENALIPAQVVVYSPSGSNHSLQLPFGTSLYDLKQAQMPDPDDLAVHNGLRTFTVPAAMVRVSEAFFTRNPVEAQVALAAIQDESVLLRSLLDGGRTAIAGRLGGAFRRIGRPEAADEILKTMKAAGYDVRENDPFAPRQTFVSLRSATAPIAGRLQAMWARMRAGVLETFPKAPGQPKSKAAYLRFVDEIYKSDAYHSLSIEGYNVTPALVERVRSGNWDPGRYPEDRQNRDALSARGYWQAFQSVRASLAEILAGANPGAIVRTAHRQWYRELFQPFVAAQVVPASALAGYRTAAVFLRASRYVPPRWEALRDAMPVLFDLLQQESEHSVRAVLGHWLFGYLHPYPDGNGRMARFVMNAMLAAGGYPWTVIKVEKRDSYLSALDKASIEMNVRPFAAFLAGLVRRSSTRAQG